MQLWQALALVIVGSLAIRAWCPALAAAALLANWWACSEFSAAFAPEGDAFMALAAIDILTALVVLVLPPSRHTALLALTYVAGLLMHSVYGFSYCRNHGREPWSYYYYLTGLHYMAWSQLWLVSGWAGGELVGVCRRVHNSDRSMGAHGSVLTPALRADRKAEK